MLYNKDGNRVLTGDWFSTSAAFLSEEVTIAFGTVRFLLTGGELLLGKLFLTVSTGKTFTMPWHVLVRYTTLVDNLKHK